MSSDHARRGRPRGSGLDDSALLRQIAELLAADPDLKPTTAIKVAGVSDPSTIRRLRDKLKTEPVAGHILNSVPSPSGVSLRPLAELAEAHTPLSSSSRGEPATDPSAGLSQTCSVSAAYADAHRALFTQWYAFGLFAVSSAVEAQMAILDDLVKVPPVECALRRQLLLNEVAKAFCPQRSDLRTTLH